MMREDGNSVMTRAWNGTLLLVPCISPHSDLLRSSLQTDLPRYTSTGSWESGRASATNRGSKQPVMTARRTRSG